MMGSGKSTVGHALARRLRRPLLDTDVEIVTAIGMPIAQIFSTRGEAWFRAKESEVISDCLATQTPAVLSLGGGAVLSEHNRLLLRSWSDVVWLRADLDTLVARVGTGAGRPVLAGDPEGVLRRLIIERAPLYTDTAGIIVDVDDRPTQVVVAQIIRAVERARRSSDSV